MKRLHAAIGQTLPAVLGGLSRDAFELAEPPLRAALFGISQLQSHAQVVAGNHKTDERPGPERLLPRLRENERVLQTSYRIVAGSVAQGRHMEAAAEWLLDNYYLVEEQIRVARELLPKSYSRELPRLRSGPFRGFPVVYELVLELVTHTDGHVDIEHLSAFTTAYQQVRSLKLGELWAVPIMLRLALIENLRRVAYRIAWRRRNRDRGQAWAQRFLAVVQERPKDLITALADLARADLPLHTPFIAELSSGLRGQSAALGLVLNWLEQELGESGQTLEQVLQAESQEQAADQASIANSISSLRRLNTQDWRAFVESESLTETILRQDPPGVYAATDFRTRDRCRHVVEELARRCKLDEPAVARQALALAEERSKRAGTGQREQHVGFFLIAEGRRELEAAIGYRPPVRLRLARAAGRVRLALYLGPMALFTVLLAATFYPAVRTLDLTSAWWALVAAVPLLLVTSQTTVRLVNWGVTHLVPPRPLPRMDFSAGIPDAHRTAVVVPTMLTSLNTVRQLVRDLELRYLANRDPNLRFVLLTDFPDAPSQELPTDKPLLEAAASELRELNARYTAPDQEVFLLLHRPRLWNPAERVWMGYERKRGKLADFNRLLLTGQTGRFSVIIGDARRLEGVRYVITLDTDTQLPPQTAWKMVGAMAHPLNRPVINPATQCVERGYGVIQPRMANSLVGAGRSRFAKLFAGEVGLDPYTREVSNTCHDMFGRGQFIGKGIYDVAAFHAAVGERFPEDTVLSHDLIEGCHARCGFLNDVELIEDQPSRFLADVNRRLRWIRGDWQIAAWLGRHVPAALGHRQRNPLDLLSRWLILDNLRRSLVPAAFLAALICAWLLPGCDTLLGTATLLGLWFLPQVVRVICSVPRPPKHLPFRAHWADLSRQEGRQFLVELIELCCVPYSALRSLGAIARVYWRKCISHRRMLEWQTAHDAERGTRLGCVAVFWEMKAAPAAAVLTAAAIGVFHRGALPAAVPFLCAWMFAPLVAWWISRSAQPSPSRLRPDQQAFLRRLARRTWAYFEHFGGADQNWLPPDNYQESPDGLLAERTSPTNIGLCLLSTAAAWDFGYLSARATVQRLGHALRALESLPRYRGHFLNWYSTRDRQPLHPFYVSTVDSGNLAAHLVVLRGALQELATAPVLPPRWRQGLTDVAGLVAQELGREAAKDAAAGPEWKAARDTFRETLVGLEQAPDSLPDVVAVLRRCMQGLDALAPFAPPAGETAFWIQAARRQCDDLRSDILFLAPWLEEGLWGTLRDLPAASAPPGWAELLDGLSHPQPLSVLASQSAELAPSLETWKRARNAPLAEPLAALAAAIQEGSNRAAALIADVEDLIQRTRELGEMDLEFLYDRSRKLLSIGYALESHRLDPGSYDLLASEARLCSYLGIAQNKLPQEHWFLLGRQSVVRDGPQTLVSWSGSMFEYLMPLLVMPTYGNTLLDQACRGAAERQIRYGRREKIPWGMSESCYNQFDRHMVYQYRAFGVPELGLKRGLASDLVIAPYASAMALMVAPEEACVNLERMAKAGFVGRYGLYEAVDYTPSRLRLDQRHAVVRCHMAHHSGMALLALAYALLNRPMQRRFLSDPECRAAALLLQERIPSTRHVRPIAQALLAPAEAAEEGGVRKAVVRRYERADTPVPAVHLLSNGRYSVIVNNAGGGFSRWQGLALTRWREDIAGDNWGTFFYIQDVEQGKAWSASYLPMRTEFDAYEAIFSQGRTEFRSRYQQIEALTVIAVSPEEDVEVRRLTLTNLSARPRVLEVTTYAEVVLNEPRAELSHPAFSNLFVETEAVTAAPILLCRRRPRVAGEALPWMCHMLTLPNAAAKDVSYETDRARFVGRGRTPAAPAALNSPGPLSGTAGAVLDPVLALRCRLTLEPGESVSLHAVTGAAPDREAVLTLAGRYQSRQLADRVFDTAWTHSHVMLHHLRITDADAELFGRLAGSIIYTNPTYRGPASLAARNRRGQSDLWRYGISGDLPIVLVRITESAGLELARQMIQAHAYWRNKGLGVDLVIWADAHAGYRQSLVDEVIGLVSTGTEAKVLDQPAGIFVRSTDQLPEEDQTLLQAVARVVLSDRSGTLAEQTERQVYAPTYPSLLKPSRRPAAPLPDEDILTPRDLTHFNGLGGFTPDGREYVILLPPGQATPAPWVNVLANANFGAIVSETGSGYTWFQNAHEYRLTTWHNDPVSDPSGEAFYVRDEETGQYWSPSAGPARGRTPYVCRHGLGYTAFEHTQDGISTEVLTYVATDAPVKLTTITVCNLTDRDRRISLTGYCEWVLGETRERNAPHVVSRLDPQTGALFAHNAYTHELARPVAFFQATGGQRSHTADRVEFIGRTGSLSAPEALRRQRLSGAMGAGLDPCAAVQVYVDVPAGQERQIVFTLGAAQNEEEARDLLRRFSGKSGARQALETVWQFWKHLTGGVYVETPDSSVNHLLNNWLLYQVTACRFWGRSGFYQSGGAYGFRDQLQDSMAFLLPCPWLTRPHLLRCAARQFREGDVLHWWHPPSGRGVRTRFSDDYLWLPLATSRYVLGTGDTGVLDELTPFLEGRALAPGEESVYAMWAATEERASLYEHCVRAIKHAARFGPHGLPLMGCGDWNDGLNRVGIGGKGESVWLAFFLCEVLRQFEKVARLRQDEAFAEQCRAWSAELQARIEEHAWDGQWYRRAFFDDGQPLGSVNSPECKIDLLPQSWAVLSGAGQPERAGLALQAVLERLVDPDLRLIKLLTPPFDKAPWDPGYIRGYLPGVRENGGQYTHAAVWTAMAFAARGDAAQAWRLFSFINPISHGDTPENIAVYKVEPYVAAADVYTLPAHGGRGGWTWYTGSAAWMYRLLMESLLGISREGDRLTFAPVVPEAWPSYRVHYRYNGTMYHIEVTVVGPATSHVRSVRLDDAEMADNCVPLVDDHQEHFVSVQVG